MRHFKKPERNQLVLMAHIDLNSVAPVGSAVRTIDDLVTSLDTTEIEKQYALDSVTGRNPIHPKTIIKVCLFAIHSCRFSLRKMEYDTRWNLAYRWLAGEHIDHSTIGKFLISCRDLIEELFTQTVVIAVERELVDFEVLAIDSVKLRASASHKEEKNSASLIKMAEKIRGRIKELLDDVSTEANELEVTILRRREQRLADAKKELCRRVEVKSVGKSECEKKKIVEKEKINITDFDAHKMQQGNGEINPSYSTTTAVDVKADIITHYQVNESDNDNKALIPAIEGSAEKCDGRHKIVDADPGFSSFGNLEKLEETNQKALIPDKRFEIDERGEQKRGKFDRSNFTYDAASDTYLCPAEKTLEMEATFQLNGRAQHRYGNAAACKECPFIRNCTSGEKRTITRDANEEIKEEMRVELAKPENKNLYKLRAHAAESPFGNIKHNLKYRILLRRTAERVKIEIGLLCILHNFFKIGNYRAELCSA